MTAHAMLPGFIIARAAMRRMAIARLVASSALRAFSQ
jgi:hypothetical protein